MSMCPMNIRRAAGSATAVACASLALAGCGSSGSSSTDGPTVLASFYPLAFVAERVGGDDVTVENLTQPGAESHDLELTARQVGQVRSEERRVGKESRSRWAPRQENSSRYDART